MRLATSLLVKITSVIFCLYILTLSGCRVYGVAGANEVDASIHDVHVLSLELLDGSTMDFREDPFGYAILRGKVIHRWLEAGSVERISLDSVLSLKFERPATVFENTMNVILVAIGIGLGALLLFALTFGQASFH